MRVQSSPALEFRQKLKPDIGPRSSSQPMLVPVVACYVDKLKGQPFSLKEKMTGWCKRSPMALIKSHEPPQDHWEEYPTPQYEDKMCDNYGRNTDTLQQDCQEATTKLRMELVLRRYAPRHGLKCSFDLIPSNGKEKAPAMSTATFHQKVHARFVQKPHFSN